MTFALAPKQGIATQLLGKQRHTCLVGGSRSMKTFTIVRAITYRASKYPASKHGIFRFRANAARASISLDTIPKVSRLCYPTLRMQEHRQDGFFELPNGSQIWVGGLDDDNRTEKILGNEFSTLFLNECSQIPYSSVLIALTRLAANVDGCAQRAYYDLNPVGKGHYTNVMFGEKKEPRSRVPYANPDNYARMFMHPRDNPHLSPEYLEELQNLPERQRKRFYEGEYVDEVEGALWPYEVIEQSRAEFESHDECKAFMKRICICVDPSGASNKDNEDNDEIGIIVTGLGNDNKGYVLEDCSLKAGPDKWGKQVVNAYERWDADCVIAESNFGGEMVRFVINTASKAVSVRLVSASRGKTVRAEPISSLYAKGMVRHVGRMPLLEDQMAAWATTGYMGEGSPDRADAMIWGFTYLMLKLDGGANLIEFYRRENEANAKRAGAAAALKEEPARVGITVEEAMRAEAIERAAMLPPPAPVIERPRARNRKGAAALALPSPAQSEPVRRSSFYAVAEAEGKVGAPDPLPPTKPAVVTHQEGSTIVRYGPERVTRERKTA